AMSEPPKWLLAYYQDARGNRPVEEWLGGLNEGDYARVFRYFEMLEKHGTNLRRPFAAHLRGKLWELIPGDYRVLYCAIPNRRFLLVHAFRKKTNKTPQREIAIAENRFTDYERR